MSRELQACPTCHRVGYGDVLPWECAHPAPEQDYRAGFDAALKVKDDERFVAIRSLRVILETVPLVALKAAVKAFLEGYEGG